MSKKTKALKSALELQKWICTKISEAEHEAFDPETLEPVNIEKTKAWQELSDAMRNGHLASFRDEFEQAISGKSEPITYRLKL